MIRILFAGAAAALVAAPAPASKKPCRDAQGRVIECPKPKSPPTPRCKDEKGRFVKCPEVAKPPSAR